MTAYRPFSRNGAPILLGLAALLTACSGDEYNYTAPNEICDTPIDPQALQAVLPPGDEVEATSLPLSITVACEIKVDSRLQIDIRGLALSGARDPSERAATFRMENSVEENWGPDFPAVLADDGAVVSLPCGTGGRTDALLTEIHLYSDHMPEDERRDRATDFTRSYVTGLAEQLNCDARPATTGSP
ncbi:hypothetical protein [Streptomyces marincola]|uniref:hypothetical protein n=1 Tax=Streptomyces marincola TaxID=2878388 RepID=UPI001CF39745|nr:hypothetical protein [Streptomyces marincola]UCM90778.1 hypothetical protein LC193_24120 [Streptomyces marincola]